MAISDERKHELEPLCIRVFNQIGAGYEWEKIKTQFSHIDADPEEVEWVIDDGRRRYRNFMQSIENSNKHDGKSNILFALASLALLVVILSFVSFHPTGRGVGRAMLLGILAVGGIGYGLWGLINSRPKGFRTDIDD
jgi:hypothetical protein